MSGGQLLGLLAVLIWATVGYIGWRRHADVTLLAIIAVLVGSTTGVALAQFDVLTPSLWGFTVSGLLLLWLVAPRRPGT